jgi:hypothetical protein
MTKDVYKYLDVLAERYIPEGKHNLLHVNSREAWLELMTSLIELDLIKVRMPTLIKYAISWELLLTQKLSIQN